MNIPHCTRCIHFRNRPGTAFCSAYPDGIPEDIKWDRLLHTEVFPDQRGNAVWTNDGRDPSYKPAHLPENQFL